MSPSLLTPLSLVPVVVREVSPTYCTGWSLVTNMSSFTVLLASLLIGLDQFLAIVTPLHYHSVVCRGRLVSICVLAWSVSLLLPLLASLTAQASLPSSVCGDREATLATRALHISLATLLILLPYLLIVIIHVKVFISARTNSVRIRRNSVSSERRVSVSVPPNTKDLQLLQGEAVMSISFPISVNHHILYKKRF